jgi:hypothetical protein
VILSPARRRQAVLFMHEMGYTYFDMNKLTINETNELIKAFNEKGKNLEAQAKRQRSIKKTGRH